GPAPAIDRCAERSVTRGCADGLGVLRGLIRVRRQARVVQRRTRRNDRAQPRNDLGPFDLERLVVEMGLVVPALAALRARRGAAIGLLLGMTHRPAEAQGSEAEARAGVELAAAAAGIGPALAEELAEDLPVAVPFVGLDLHVADDEK